MWSDIVRDIIHLMVEQDQSRLQFRDGGLTAVSTPTPTHSVHAEVAPASALRGDTHVQTGVIGEHAVVAQGDVLLLPLFVQRFAASLQQHALGGTGSQGQINKVLCGL